jgi:hypothetical protein
MSDFFFSKLPQGHAIRSISKQAATTSIQAEALVVAAPDSSVDGLRRQCAAVVWVSSDVYSLEAVEKLHPAERSFLLKLFGLPGGGASKAQARRIDDHVQQHRPGAGACPPANNGGGAGAGGAGGGGAANVGLDSLAGALLTPAQAATLDTLPRATVVMLLNAAGMPFDATDAIGTLRGKCATATWAGERLRRPNDVTSLPAAVSSLVLEAFGVPASWKTEARDRALEGVLQSCRDSPWAVDPATSHGLIAAERSAIFRIAEQLQERKRSSAAVVPDQFLSADEQAQLTATLALTGNALADIECVGGQWRLKPSCGSGGAGAALPFQSADDSAALSTLEKQIRTLRVETYTLLTADERKDQANRAKAVPGRKRTAAFPGDTEGDDEELSFNPFAEWPHEQSLRFEASYSYSLCGRMLRNALRWCNRHFTDALVLVTWKGHQQATAEMYASFTDAVSTRRHDFALLQASLAISEATTQMTAILANAKSNATRFPQSKLLRHIASRRETQALELKILLADLGQRITDATKHKDQSGAAALATASWIDFLDGWLTKSDKSLVSAESLELASAAATAAAPQQTPGFSGGASGAAGSTSPGTKAPRTATAHSPGSGGGSAASNGFITPLGKLPLRRICVFQQNIPCSVEIVGDTLGVPGAPPCTRCGKGNHFHGECPTEWGKLRRPLPGFLDDGSRIDKAWNKNEPIQRTVTAWTKFLQDKSNFKNRIPEVAGVPGAPDLADFQARVPGAPAKP